MNQPSPVAAAPPEAGAQITDTRGQSAAAGSANAGSQANAGVDTAQQEMAALQKRLADSESRIETLMRQVQETNELNGELSTRLGDTRTAEQQQEQLKTLGKQFQDAVRDDDNPEKVIAFIANISQITQANLTEQRRNFATAYGKVEQETKDIGVSFHDLDMHVLRHTIDLGTLQTPKQVRALIEQVKRVRLGSIDIEAAKKDWEADFVKRQAQANASPRPATSPQFPNVDLKDPTSRAVAAVMTANSARRRIA